MRSFFALLLLTSCAAGSPPSESATPPVDVKAAWESYSAYCSLCRNGSPCCMKEADFAPERWSKQSGRYLSAMRDFYDCEFAEASRSEVYGDRERRNDPLTADSVDFPTMSNYARNCEPHACQRYGEVMVRELDRALATPSPHPAGALVACSGP